MVENISLVALAADKILAALFLVVAAWCMWKREDAFRLKLTLFVCLGFLGVFGFLRGVLWVSMPDFFAGCSGLDALRTFARGIQFDLAALATTAGLFIWLLNFPSRSVMHYRICFVALACVFSIVLLLGVGDIVYFHFVKRHVGTELLLMFRDTDLVGGLALSQYLWVVLVWIGVSLLAVWGAWKNFGISGRTRPASWRLEIACLLCLGVLIFFAFRGVFGFRLKPVNIQAAYKDGQLECGHLALNGIFSAYKSLSKKYAPKVDLVPSEEALSRARELLSSVQETRPDELNYPLQRVRREFNASGRGMNFVILLLESWEIKYTDALAGTSYGATPNLDELIRSGVTFDNFYASGQRSINGVGTIMTGVPQLPGLPYYSLGLEAYGVSGLADILRREGYRTIFTQPSGWGSAGVALVAEVAGFEEIYTASDIPSLGGYYGEGFVSDADALEFFAGKLIQGKKPFFGFFFSAAMHPPFSPIKKEFERYPWDGPDTGYLNALNYTDDAIGHFIVRLKAAGLYENTVFIIVADHTLGWGESGSFDGRFHIPAVLHAPKLFQPAKRREVASQADIFPTVLDILQVSSPYSALGNSVLDQSARRFAFTSMDGRVLGWKDQLGVMEHTGKNRVNVQSASVHFSPEEAERNTLSLAQAVYELLKAAHWAPVFSAPPK